MKIKVDQEKCIGCGACVAIASKNFDFNEEGLSIVIGEEITDETRNAIDACPVYAISIEEEEKENTKSESQEKACKCSDGDECTCGDECSCKHEGECDDTCDCEHECWCEHEDKEEAA